jgi:hypothetical protein
MWANGESVPSNAIQRGQTAFDNRSKEIVRPYSAVEGRILATTSRRRQRQTEEVVADHAQPSSHQRQSQRME